MASMNPETKQYARDSRKRIDGLSRELATVRALLENNPAIDPTAAGRLTRLETDMQAIKARMEAFGDQPPQVILDAMKTESARLEKRPGRLPRRPRRQDRRRAAARRRRPRPDRRR